MKISRLIELSLFYQLRDLLSVKKTNDIAKSVDFISYQLKYNNISTTKDVVVKVDGNIVASGYSVDYLNGIVNFDIALTQSNQVKVDYYYCNFNIYDESSNETSESFKYPAVAIYEDETETKPYELGSSQTEKTKTYIIQVFSERGGERNDVTDSIVELLEGSIGITDYNLGFPLNEDGTLNDSFDPYQIITYTHAESINYRKGGSLDIGNKPKFYSEIIVDLKIFI
ncbi:hypothetical protein [Paenibacillus xylanexedens]|uniref:hypothetical protein n=1 Tax=Paenibacillus xylanexedens TaxID=528191 RepID=UPI000F52DBE1|nr:hypothetical protein [Paenibacillus xylanexedens]RPK20067.1 hypothetical protein EDO6_06584 [Paenibacillus xylanexedens]